MRDINTHFTERRDNPIESHTQTVKAAFCFGELGVKSMTVAHHNTSWISQVAISVLKSNLHRFYN